MHIPFCVQKCRYCDFLSAPASLQKREEYVEELIKSIDEQKDLYCDYEVISIFLGGGTPSLLESEQLERILRVLKNSFAVRDDAEITIEVNPGTTDCGKWEHFRRMGINRASIGLQSANHEELKLLGRIHTYEEFLECFQDARRAGFDNLNVDLISSLPGQTIASYQETLSKVLQLAPEHISAYSLIVEEGTPFYQMFYENGKEKPFLMNGKEYRLLSEEEDREIYHLTKKVLKKHGYERYEISNYARNGRECRHNLVYWRRGDYLGLGAGASSMIGNVRFTNAGNAPFGHREIERLSVEDQMAEFMFLGLRTIKGVSTRTFQETFHKELYEVYGTQLAKLEREKLICVTEAEKGEKWVCLTSLGLDVSNYAMSEFVN